MRASDLLQGTNLQPREYQIRIADKTADIFGGRCLERGLPEKASTILIESPTGSGKTAMGLMTAKRLQLEAGVDVIWTAMRRELLKQAVSENDKHGLGVNFTPLSMFAGNLPDELLPHSRTRPLLMIVDEAQHDAASSMAHLYNSFQPEYTLGLTATPFRTDKMKLCFEVVIKDADIYQLIEAGYLSQFSHFTIDNWEVEFLAKCYLSDIERWGKSIFFFNRMAQCYELQSRLGQAGIRVEVVNGDSDRDTQLRDFESGAVQVIANCMVLTEGFDCPSLKTVWCRPSGRGPTVQMAGRVLRCHSDLPLKQIVQSSDTKWPFQRTARPAEQYVWHHNNWRSLTINPLLNTINANAMRAIANSTSAMDPWLKSRKTKRTIKLGG